MNQKYRYEIKFVVDEQGLSNFVQWIYLDTQAKEKYQERRVNSLYLDDIYFSSVKDNLSGVSNRRKTRLRWYGDENYSCPSLELKTRNGRLITKTSYPVRSLEKNLFDSEIGHITKECNKQIKNEDLLNHILISSLQTRYSRKYFEDPQGLRITIDKDIKFLEGLPYRRLNESASIAYPFKIVELKFDLTMKNKVSELLRPLHMTPRRHSKYLTGLAMLGYAVYI